MRRTLLMLYASNWAIMHTGTTQRVVYKYEIEKELEHLYK